MKIKRGYAERFLDELYDDEDDADNDAHDDGDSSLTTPDLEAATKGWKGDNGMNDGDNQRSSSRGFHWF